MSAREDLTEYAATTRTVTADGLAPYLDAHRVGVLAEVTVWLLKKAREYRAEGTKLGRVQADTAAVLASKVRRGAVRPDNLRMLPATFFEPDRTYTRDHHGETITFVVHAVSTSPDGHTTVAHGWRQTPYTGGGWEVADSDDFTGWTDTTEAGGGQ